MKTFICFALLLASTASAQPKHEETTGRVSYTEKNAKRDAPRREGDWIEIASATPVKHGTEFAFVGAEQGPIGKLRLDAQGKVVVRRVKVFFEDGKAQVIELNRHLDDHHRSAVIDLQRVAPLDRVVVTTDTYGNGSYSVYGSSAGGGVASR